MSEKRARGARCSAEQYAILVNSLSENNNIISGKHSLADSKKTLENWKILTEILNAEKGATKTVDQWEKVSNLDLKINTLKTYTFICLLCTYSSSFY